MHLGHRSLHQKHARPPYPNPELGYEHFKQPRLDHSQPSISIPRGGEAEREPRGGEAERDILINDHSR